MEVKKLFLRTRHADALWVEEHYANMDTTTIQAVQER